MKKFLAFTLIFLLVSPLSIIAFQNESSIIESLAEKLIDDELIDEIMWIVEDGLVEKEEAENLSMLMEEKLGIVLLEPIDVNEEIEPTQISVCSFAVDLLLIILRYTPECIIDNLIALDLIGATDCIWGLIKSIFNTIEICIKDIIS